MLSIVVSWRDRVELGQALPGLLDSAQALGGDVTVVNYSGSRELLAAQLTGRGGEARVVEVVDERYFNKSRAQNLGAAHSQQPLLFFCDCDILVEPEIIQG